MLLANSIIQSAFNLQHISDLVQAQAFIVSQYSRKIADYRFEMAKKVWMLSIGIDLDYQEIGKEYDEKKALEKHLEYDNAIIKRINDIDEKTLNREINDYIYYGIWYTNRKLEDYFTIYLKIDRGIENEKISICSICGFVIGQYGCCVNGHSDSFIVRLDDL